ncbi:MAG: threonylcarbamoyl-AMP synthase [Dehalococcoidia bacterium]|nr:threonylcarbamoyl-AMP synthase [Dehalococcoidia bacterium]
MLTANSYVRQVTEAARVLAEGGVVAFPTDTVYGLGADARNEAAVHRVFDIKGRPPHSPLPLLIADISQVTAVAQQLSPIALCLATRFWPGALTLVVPARLPLSSALVQDGFVGLRIPDDPFCLRLIERFGGPITGTSANLTGAAPCMTADEVRKQLGKSVDYILDAGRAGGALPSTVVKIDGKSVSILRHGAIPDEAIHSTIAECAEQTPGAT